MPPRATALHARLSLACLCGMWTIPFLISHHAILIPTFYREWIAAVLGLLSGTILLRRKLIKEIDVPIITLIPLGLILILGIQYAAHLYQTPSKPLIVALYLVWSAAVMTTAFNLKKVVSTEDATVTAAFSILAGAVISAILLAMQLAHVGTDSFLTSSLAPGAGNLGQRNHLANYLWLGVASAILLHLRGHLRRYSLVIILAALVTASSFTGSRSILLYSFVQAAIATWAYRKYGDPELRRIALISVSLFACLLLLLLGLASLPMDSLETTATAGSRLITEASTTPLRLQLWRTGLLIFSEHPWLGVGVGQFPYQSYLLVGQITSDALFGGAEHTHNLFVQLLCEWGAIAPILLIVLGGLWWKHFTRVKWAGPEWWIAATLLVIFTHSQLEYPLWYTFVLGTFSFALGLGTPIELRYRATDGSRLVISLMLALGSSTLISLLSDYQQLESAVSPTSATRSHASDHDRIRVLSRIGRESLFSDYQSLVFAQALAIDREILADKIAVSKAAIRVAPINSITFKLAWLYALNGDRDEAILALRRAIATHPTYVPTARIALAALIEAFPETDWLDAEFERLTANVKQR